MNLRGNIDKQKHFLVEEIECSLSSEGEGEKKLTDDSHDGNSPPAYLCDLKVSKLLEMKSTVEEYYGDGVFKTVVGEGIAQLVSLVLEKKRLHS